MKETRKPKGTEGTARAKALRYKCIWHFRVIIKRPIRLNDNGRRRQGGRQGTGRDRLC